MQIKANPLLLLLLPILIFACNNSKELSEAEMKKIVADCNAKLEKCFLESNLSNLIEVYAPDARLCPNRDSFYTSKESISNFWKEDFASSKLVKMQTNTLSVNGDIDLIYETGITYTESMSNDSLYKGSAKFINVWKRQPDGSYKLAIDFWNSLKQ